MLVLNPTKLPVTIRVCDHYDPVTGAACSGNPLKPRHYNNCPSDLAANSNATVYFDADTQYIAFVNGAVELGELWASKTGAAWPRHYAIPAPHEANTTAPKPKRAPESFVWHLKTDVKHGDGVISLNITRSLAPKGVDHLYELIEQGYYRTPAAFFRVVPKFVVQFGISGSPSMNKKWTKAIKDDPVKASNLAWTISYATSGPNTRTTQFFINYADNARLDKMGFAPFGTVIVGRDVAGKIFNPTPGDSGGVDQDAYTSKGEAWIKKTYPKVNSITGTTTTLPKGVQKGSRG